MFEFVIFSLYNFLCKSESKNGTCLESLKIVKVV